MPEKSNEEGKADAGMLSDNAMGGAWDIQKVTGVTKDIVDKILKGAKECEVLLYFHEETRLNVIGKIKQRQQIIDAIIKDSVSDSDEIFWKIFGYQSHGMRMIVRPFGLYFYGDETSYQKVTPGFYTGIHAGVIFSYGYEEFLQRKEFAGCVGFGDKESADHELTHMFNSMLPFNENFAKIETDPSRSTDNDSMRNIKEYQYRTWANSLLKDELLARIVSEEIVGAEQTTIDVLKTSKGGFFTSYEPDSLFDYMSANPRMTKMFGKEPIPKEEENAFWERYDGVVNPIREHWLGIYNEVIRTLTLLLQTSVPVSHIKAVIIESSFETISQKLMDLSNMYAA